MLQTNRPYENKIIIKKQRRRYNMSDSVKIQHHITSTLYKYLHIPPFLEALLIQKVYVYIRNHIKLQRNVEF